jgi:hypothetical protein
MARLPAHVRERQPAQVVHYVDTAPAAVAPATDAELAARREYERLLYLRWKQRQAAIAVRDRKVRRFWLGFGAMTGLAVLTVIGLVGWLVWQFLAGLGLSVLAVPVVLAVTCMAALGGHRCITIVQHWH